MVKSCVGCIGWGPTAWKRQHDLTGPEMDRRAVDTRPHVVRQQLRKGDLWF
jgi:hypothetical protein